ncbi:efflux RND transporter permease subunit [Terrisporobacter hibernicus]|uniref:MMPL family transporter n=1 Tax=Terrisporobacter hibernicus TaxID=2813371 RepID=A0AAX2ZBN7_9FIRM|nr:MMPL family transporter [Terrisporobacter hibernicus]UEL46668.1 MMPL family transporter [Terrisporobacter hibernicus]
MERIAEKIANHSKLILLLAVILLIPSAFGYFNTNINYDILSYLPDNISTTKAEKLLKDDFGCGTLAMLIVENMDDKDVSKVKDKIAQVDGVADVLWVDDFMDLSVPKEILPKDMTDFLYNGDKSTMMIVKMEKATGDIKTQNAVSSIRSIAGKQAFLSGMCGILKDTKDLADKEVPLYILAASILILVILFLTLESSVIPIIFLTSIGMAVIYNFGSNIIFGEISYITKALAAVLQLGVTMDYSIFLLHRYEEEKIKCPKDKKSAMASAIKNTFISVAGGSVTTIAGFLALCTMELGFGKDIGLVMAKGVLIGVLSTITILPSFILVFDKQIEKYKHRTVMPKFNKVSKIIVKNYKKLAILFVIIFIPSYFGYKNANVYYNLDESLPSNFPSIIATNKMKTDYSMESTNFILVKDSVSPNDLSKMIKEIENLDGITSVIGLEKYIGPRVYQDFLPDDILSEVKSNGYEQILVNSKYKAATDKCNAQIEKLNKIVHEYDSEGLVGGEAPLTLDLIKIADTDFKKVSAASIIAIFIIIALLFKSASLPVILVATIQCAIFLNLGIPYYTGNVEPFIASIVLGTIQLGATIDYAILLTSRFREERNEGYEKFEAMERSIKGSAPSIITSALSFFGATVGVGLISKLDMISALCTLMARGAIVSMFIIIFILPAILLLFEGIVIKTSKNFITKKELCEETN